MFHPRDWQSLLIGMCGATLLAIAPADNAAAMSKDIALNRYLMMRFPSFTASVDSSMDWRTIQSTLATGKAKATVAKPTAAAIEVTLTPEPPMTADELAAQQADQADDASALADDENSAYQQEEPEAAYGNDADDEDDYDDLAAESLDESTRAPEASVAGEDSADEMSQGDDNGLSEESIGGEIDAATPDSAKPEENSGKSHGETVKPLGKGLDGAHATSDGSARSSIAWASSTVLNVLTAAMVPAQTDFRDAIRWLASRIQGLRNR